MQKSIRLVKISDALYFSDNAEEDGISVRIGLVNRNNWRLNFRITSGSYYEDEDEFYQSFDICVSEARKLLKRRGIALDVIA